MSVGSLTVDPGVTSSILAQFHTFVEIHHEIISMVCSFFVLFSTSQLTILQLHRDWSSWGELVLSQDQCVLLKDTTQ